MQPVYIAPLGFNTSAGFNESASLNVRPVRVEADFNGPKIQTSGGFGGSIGFRESSNLNAGISVKAPSAKVEVKPIRVEAPRVNLNAGFNGSAGFNSNVDVRPVRVEVAVPKASVDFNVGSGGSLSARGGFNERADLSISPVRVNANI